MAVLVRLGGPTPRVAAAVACLALSTACTAGRPDLAPAAHGAPVTPVTPATPSPPVAVTPRPPGPPLYYPAPHYRGPDPVDVGFAMAVTPYYGLTYGSRFTIVLTYTNNERRPVTVNPHTEFGSEFIVKVVDDGGGTVRRTDNHTATNARYPHFANSVDFPDFELQPGVTRLRVVLEVVDVECRGGGDFVTEVAGGTGRVVKRGSGGGRHLVWVDNDAQDYARHLLAQGTASPPAAQPVCRARSVE